MFALHFTRLIAALNRVSAQGEESVSVQVCTSKSPFLHTNGTSVWYCVLVCFSVNKCMDPSVHMHDFFSVCKLSRAHTHMHRAYFPTCWHSSSLASLCAPNSPYSKQTSPLSFLSLSLSHTHTYIHIDTHTFLLSLILPAPYWKQKERQEKTWVPAFTLPSISQSPSAVTDYALLCTVLSITNGAGGRMLIITVVYWWWLYNNTVTVSGIFCFFPLGWV